MQASCAARAQAFRGEGEGAGRCRPRRPLSAAEPSPPSAALLRQHPFRSLSFTRFSSRVAQNALNLGLVLLVLEATGRSFFTGLLVLALVVPATVAGVVAGVAADTFPRRLIVAAGNVARAAVCVGFISGGGGAASLYVVAVLLAICTQFVSTAEGAILPALVRRGELARANAIGQAVGGAAQIAGFAVLTPVVLRVFGSADALFAVAAVLFLVAAVHAVLIGPVERAPADGVAGSPRGGQPPWWKAGWLAIRADPFVYRAAVELTLLAMALIILGGLIPLYIRDMLDLSFEVGALVLTPAAVGMVLGLRVAGPLARRGAHSALSSAGFAAFATLLLALSFVNEEASFLGGYGAFAWLNDFRLGNFDGGALLAMGLVLPLGFAYAIVSVTAQTVLNDRVALGLQGRVLATQGAMAALAASLPVLAAGALGDWLGVQPVMAILAAAIATAAAINLRS